MELKWINFLKGMAILAVIFDHLYTIVYNSDFIHSLTIYSVTLFILLAGVTSSISLQKKNTTYTKYIKKRILGIGIPYLIATLIYHLYQNHMFFNLNVFIKQLIMFNASGPFYFVQFYIQIILLAPLIYNMLTKRMIPKQVLVMFLIYLFSAYLTHYTSIANFYGGAGKVLGGSYLFVFSLGMFIQINVSSFPSIGSAMNKMSVSLIGLLLSSVCIFTFVKFGFIDHTWANPPNKYTLLYTLNVAFLLYFFFNVITKLGWYFNHSFLLVEFIGKNSLYVFLYHSLFINLGIRIGLDQSGKTLLVIFLLFSSLCVGTILSYVEKKISRRFV